MAGYIKNKENVQNRLKRIEGQVRGLQRMVDEEKYCIDILTQINSVQAALEQVSLLLAEDHILHCVAGAAQQGNAEEKVGEIMAVLKRHSK
ncbi:MAG TPA: metal-sensitive transcriptional regulator [Chloroflexia bacterium]|nr:metal-sensitive transcriptional regulator [Chloroflexia bacterium]